MAKKDTYVAISAGWVAGVRLAEGDEIELTAAQAKYENVRLKAAPRKKTKSAE